MTSLSPLLRNGHHGHVYDLGYWGRELGSGNIELLKSILITFTSI